MHFVFLDEFGHIGPFVSRKHPRFNTSPVFGIGGYLIHERSVRDFAHWFYRLKADRFEEEISSSSKHPATWEKKGHEIFTRGHIYKHKRLAYSLINTIKKHGGKLFFHGIVKHNNPEESNPTGLYYTVLRHGIRALERYFAPLDENYQIVIDEHQARLALLEGASRTMFAADFPARHLLEPPYQVESHLYQTIQAADWLSSIFGALWAFRSLPEQFPDREWAEKFFGNRIATATTHSRVAPQPRKQMPLPL